MFQLKILFLELGLGLNLRYAEVFTTPSHFPTAFVSEWGYCFFGDTSKLRGHVYFTNINIGITSEINREWWGNVSTVLIRITYIYEHFSTEPIRVN